MNDSGDTARVFGIDAKGKVRVQLKFKAPGARRRGGRGRTATARSTSPTSGTTTGDRKTIKVYTIPEPAQLEDEENVKFHRYDFEYPDGAHDAETLLIEPETKRLYFVTKVKTKAGAIYAAPETSSREGTNELTKLADAPASPLG